LETDGAALLRIVEDLRHYFERADPIKLEKALKSGDIVAVCEALDLSPESVQVLLKAGQHEVLQLAQSFPEFHKALVNRAHK
jgi:hypothetical protein